MYPATLVLISHWFPRKERARANSLFSIAIPISLIVFRAALWMAAGIAGIGA